MKTPLTIQTSLASIGLIAVSFFLCSTQVWADHPLKNDPTGVNWVFSLEDAVNIAKKQNRIVLLKPVAFRSSADNDRLSPSAEALRAVALVDARVVDLLNRRFVPYYFDMDPRGSEYDELAAKLAIRLHPELKYSTTIPTPPLLFMTPESKMLGYASNFLSSTELLNRLLEIVDENPEYQSLTAGEKALSDPVARAWVHYELRQMDEAMKLLKDQRSSEAYFLRGVVRRERGQWADMKAAFKMVTDPARLNDVVIEQGLRYWEIKNYEGIKVKFKNLRRDHPRYQEAMYYLGLAYYQTNQTENCIATWSTAIDFNRESAWALRLDWSLGLARLGPDQYISPQDLQPSVLGRRYMAPDGNPDMNKR